MYVRIIKTERKLQLQTRRRTPSNTRIGMLEKAQHDHENLCDGVATQLTASKDFQSLVVYLFILKLEKEPVLI